MILSFGYAILRQVLQLLIQGIRGDRAKDVEILVLRRQIAVLRPQAKRLDLGPVDRVVLAGLDPDYPLRRNENVFPVSMAAANDILQLLTAVIAPSGIGDVGAHLYHFTTGTLDRNINGCKPG